MGACTSLHTRVNRRSEKGFSLVELIVATAVLLMVLYGARGLATSVIPAWNRLQRTQALQAEAALVLSTMERDLRQASDLSTLETVTESLGSPYSFSVPDTLSLGDVTISRVGVPGLRNRTYDVMRKDATGWWYEDRSVTYSRPSGTTTLRRTESVTWTKEDLSSTKSWTSTRDLSKHLESLSVYIWRPTSAPSGATSDGLIRVVVSVRDPSLNPAAKVRLFTVVYHRKPVIAEW